MATHFLANEIAMFMSSSDSLKCGRIIGWYAYAPASACTSASNAQVLVNCTAFF